MARDAKPWLCASLFGMARTKVPAVETAESGRIEGEARWQHGHSLSVAARALPFGVARRTKIARARCSHAMFSQEIAIVHDMGGGQDPLFG